MPRVTYAFASATIAAAGLTLRDDGAILDGKTFLRHMPPQDADCLNDSQYFELIDWVCNYVADDLTLIRNYIEIIDINDLGVLGLAVKTAPTLRASLQRIERYFPLVTDTAFYRLDEARGQGFWQIIASTQSHPVLGFRNECALATFASTMRQFIERDFDLDYVSFRHACRGDLDKYEHYFNCDVRFGEDRDGIAFRSDILDLPNRLGDKAVSEFLTGHLDAAFDALAPQDDIRSDLLRRLSSALSSGVPQAAEIARDMGMSERTLYRRLADEGLTYRDVLREAQSSLAQELLLKGQSSIAEIAFLTGFSEQSTFSRAFKRWVGQAPAQFRQQANLAQ